MSLRKLRKNRSNEMGENKSMLKKRGREVKELSTTWKNSSLLSSKTLREVSEVANQTCRIIIVSVYN